MSNLNFISKLLEKIVAKQLNDFIRLSQEGISSVHQSVYRFFIPLRQHCSKSKITSTSVDSGNSVAPTLLDLSKAFDRIDHAILHHCLKDWFCIDSTVLMWINSYLTKPKQKIKLGNNFSEAFHLPFGVPQGSVYVPSFTLSILVPLVKLFQVLRSHTICMLMTDMFGNRL